MPIFFPCKGKAYISYHHTIDLLLSGGEIQCTYKVVVGKTNQFPEFKLDLVNIYDKETPKINEIKLQNMTSW